ASVKKSPSKKLPVDWTYKCEGTLSAKVDAYVEASAGAHMSAEWTSVVPWDDIENELIFESWIDGSVTGHVGFEAAGSGKCEGSATIKHVNLLTVRGTIPTFPVPIPVWAD